MSNICGGSGGGGGVAPNSLSHIARERGRKPDSYNFIILWLWGALLRGDGGRGREEWSSSCYSMQLRLL